MVEVPGRGGGRQPSQDPLPGIVVPPWFGGRVRVAWGSIRGSNEDDFVVLHNFFLVLLPVLTISGQILLRPFVFFCDVIEDKFPEFNYDANVHVGLYFWVFSLPKDTPIIRKHTAGSSTCSGSGF